jgi:hypothetical protein
MAVLSFILTKCSKCDTKTLSLWLIESLCVDFKLHYPTLLSLSVSMTMTGVAPLGAVSHRFNDNTGVFLRLVLHQPNFINFNSISTYVGFPNITRSLKTLMQPPIKSNFNKHI